MYPLLCRVAKGANLTVVVRSSEGLKGALRGKGLGPCIEATIFNEDAGLMSVEEEIEEEEGISRYAEPEAEGTIAVCRSCALLASLQAKRLSMPLNVDHVASAAIRVFKVTIKTLFREACNSTYRSCEARFVLLSLSVSVSVNTQAL